MPCTAQRQEIKRQFQSIAGAQYWSVCAEIDDLNSGRVKKLLHDHSSPLPRSPAIGACNVAEPGRGLPSWSLWPDGDEDMNFRSTNHPVVGWCAESRAGRITQASPGNNNEEVECWLTW